MILGLALAGSLISGGVRGEFPAHSYLGRTTQLAQDGLSVADFFPLVPGTTWVYTDTSSPGTQIVEKVLPSVTPLAFGAHVGDGDPTATDDQKSPGGGTATTPFFPVEVRENGRVTSQPCFRVKGNVLYLVGKAPTSLVYPRPILKVGADQVWEYDSDPVSSIDPTPVHVVSRSKPGPITAYFGKSRRTIILTTDASVGGKSGLKIHQTFIYAEGVGLVQFDTQGTAGKNKFSYSRKLISFQAGAAI